jgi:hypothetical protein
MGSEWGTRGVPVVTDDINQQESNGIWPGSAAVGGRPLLWTTSSSYAIVR